ncbi:autotransporter outer membrane beta-barrel domain-containing protein [Mesosutterella sp. OilRF-GAM-744-9]|uniref:Autotransporter outer membrane beta-barrel domain-containing protein n=1 Tax=Mesosutterella porci TaxID=2915351 RepID=A0ABS9MR15_9BURK|nr:autotransporter outer membrane beta-barrel domain-containing protein [Mesosutterella sp. oilRF-744-WT-GAM-9]
MSAIQPALGLQNIYSTGDSYDWASQIHEVTVQGDDIAIGEANAWNNGLFHIGTGTTQSVSIAKLGLSNSRADITGSVISINQITGSWGSSLDARAGTSMTLGSSADSKGQPLIAGGAGSSITLASGGSLVSYIEFSAQNGNSKEKPASLTLKTQDDIVQTLGAQTTRKGFSAIEHSSFEAVSENGSIVTNLGILASNDATVKLFARNGKVELTSGSIDLVENTYGQSSSVTVEARSLNIYQGSVQVSAPLGPDWSQAKPDKKTKFTFEGGSLSAKSISGIGATIAINAADSVTLTGLTGDKATVYALDTDLTLGGGSAQININGGIAVHAATDATSSVKIKGASIDIDPTAGSNALSVEVHGSGSTLEIGGQDSLVNITGRVFADSGTVVIDGSSVTSGHGSTGTSYPPEAVRTAQGGHVAIGHDTTGTVELTGRLLTSDGQSSLEVNGLDIKVNRTSLQSPYDEATLATTGTDTLRLGNLPSKTETQSLQVKGVAAANGGSIELYGDKITVDGGTERTMREYSRISLLSPDGKITAGDSRTSSVTLNGSVIGSAGTVDVYGESIHILAGQKNEIALIAGGGNKPFAGDITVGTAEDTRLIQIEGKIVSASRPVTLRSGGSLSISSDTDYAVESLSGAAYIGTDETGSVTIDQAVIARGAVLDIRGGNISLSTEKQQWAAHAGGAAVSLGSDATESLKVTGGLLADGSTLNALGRAIHIETVSGETAGQTNGSSLTIGDQKTQSATVSGSLQTYGGYLQVQGSTLELNANGAHQALLARGGAIDAGTDGAGSSLSIVGNVLALGAPIHLGSAQRDLASVSGELDANGGAISVQGRRIVLSDHGEAYAAHSNGSVIDVGTDGSDQIAATGTVLAENGDIHVGSKQTASVSLTGQAHALGSDITITAASVFLAGSGEEPAGLAENGGLLSLGGEKAGLVSISGTAAARKGGGVEIGGESSGANVSGNLEAESGGVIRARFNTAGSLLSGSVLSQGEGSEVTAQFHGGRFSGEVLAQDSGAVNLEFTGAGAQLEGSIEAHRNGTVQASFAEDAGFSGRAFTTNSNTATNLSFITGSYWNVTADSNVTSLTVDGTAAISLRGAASSLTVDQTLRGSGALFDLDLDASNKNNRSPSARSDYLYFSGSAEGSQKIDFDASSFRDLSEGDKLYFATAADSGLSFTSARNLTNLSFEGALYDYSYAIDRESSAQGNDWFFRMTGRRDNGSAEILSEYGMPGYLLGTEMDRLNKREGEAVHAPGSQAGLWVRTRYGQAAVSHVQNKYALLQLGADVNRVTESGRVTLGFAFDYTDDSLTFRRGDGDAYRYGVSFYDTWRNTSGWYADAVLRAGVISNRLQGASSGGQALNTRFHNSYGSASLEVGRKAELKGGFFIEPQAQFQISVIDGASFTTSSGVRGDEGSVVSAAGRAGFRAGRSLGTGALYLKGDVLHEFAGDRAMRATSLDGRETIRRSSDGSTTWYDAGLGANVNLGRRTFLWADAEGVFGGGYGSAWQVNAGVRWKF